MAATRIGLLLTGAMNRQESGRPILAVVLGVIVLQVITLIPFIGILSVVIASIWGAGSLAFIAYRGAGGHDVAAVESAPPAAAT